MSAEDITRVNVQSKKRREIAMNGVIRLEENIASLEEKIALTDGDRFTLEYVASKLQMFDAEFHEHHYKLVDLIDGSVELEAQRRVLDDHERSNLDFFTRITNIRSREKTVTTPPKTAEEKTSLYAYHRSLYG